MDSFCSDGNDWTGRSNHGFRSGPFVFEIATNSAKNNARQMMKQLGMTQAAAERGIKRAYGADRQTGKKIQSIRVIGDGFDIKEARKHEADYYLIVGILLVDFDIAQICENWQHLVNAYSKISNL